METVAVIDFETTGMSPAMGARATEIAAVLVQGGVIVDRYRSLMHTGVHVPYFIEQLTGISNRMLDEAPPAEDVMREVLRFTEGCPLVAHNAAFDRVFWQAEAVRAGLDASATPFACTLLLSRRLYPDAPNHKLGTLASWHALPNTGRAHRALADAEVTAHLWLRLQHDVQTRYASELSSLHSSHALMTQLQSANKAALARCVQRHVAAAVADAQRPLCGM